MNRRTPLLIASGATALALTGLLGAAGASAATTVGPLFIVGYEDQTLVTGTPSDPSALTEIAASIPGLAEFVVLGGDVASGSSDAYLVVSAHDASCDLISLDLKTGTTGSRLTVVDSDDETLALSDCTGFDIDRDGTGWIFGDNALYTVNLSTSVATFVGKVVDPDAGEMEDPIFQELASDSTGALYGLTSDGIFYLIHPTEPGLYPESIRGEYIAETGVPEDSFTWTADFDQNDVLWMDRYRGVDENEVHEQLWSFTVSAPDVAAISAGDIKQGQRFIESGALFFTSFTVEETVTPAATLPDAGVSAGGALGAAALLLALGVTGLVVVRRRATL